MTYSFIEPCSVACKDSVATTRLDIGTDSTALPPGPGLGIDLYDAKRALQREGSGRLSDPYHFGNPMALTSSGLR